MGQLKPRKTGKRRYRNRFDLVCEGSKTEPQYFGWLKQHCDSELIHLAVSTMRTGQSSPGALINKATEISSEVSYQSGDQLWIILDKDRWTVEQFRDLKNWKNRKPKRHHVAVSNPKFEYWVLMHGDNAPGHLSATKCSELYSEFMDSKKGFDGSRLSISSVIKASRRSRQKFESSLDGTKSEFDFVPDNCGSTLFLLIDEIGPYLND